MRQRQWVGPVCYHCCGQVSDKKQLKGERIYFDSQSERILPIQAGKAWHWEGKATGYIVFAGRKQRTDRKWVLSLQPQGPTVWLTTICQYHQLRTRYSDTQMYERHFIFDSSTGWLSSE